MSILPRISFIVVSYKQEAFIREAVQSAFAQTYPNLEIILSDDASSDDTFEIIECEAARYKESHKLVLNRNPANLGLAGNLNAAVALASGELLIVQGGDDISMPDRTSKIVDLWLATDRHYDLIYSDVVRISSTGKVLEHQIRPTHKVTVEQLIRGKWFIAGGASAAYSRKLFAKFGPLHPDVQYEDYVLTFRALVGGGCEYIDEPLVRYRVHVDSFTRASASAAKTRSAVAKRARHFLAEERQRLSAWDLSQKRNAYLRWRLLRNVGWARLEAASSATRSRFAALGFAALALASFRTRAAYTIIRRDVLRLAMI